jgi:hypothetical protein
MISLSSAMKLKDAGLNWIPALHDFFAIPNRGLDDKVFVISEIMSYVEIRNNLPMITFHGTVEWALDHVLTSEVVWLPSEEQLRNSLMHHLVGSTQPKLQLVSTPNGYQCTINLKGETIPFHALEVSEVYAAALHHILVNTSG